MVILSKEAIDPCLLAVYPLMQGCSVSISLLLSLTLRTPDVTIVRQCKILPAQTELWGNLGT